MPWLLLILLGDVSTGRRADAGFLGVPATLSTALALYN
eukprot:CAMPEP_0172902922 /NCGR_PEP_ID=MMETSP1075-20121228/169432_1 /TAXON_ID=2916 /ORGANISM="Ceratium fusus, Strain PA161109" /LENGTH=37 /DNA_ID= /DNA_START= /DNA_END= /DNA_ORIENTATION=